MAYLLLNRANAWEYTGSSGTSKGPNGEIRANGTQHGLWSFGLSALRSAIGNRKIKVTGLTFTWSTSAKFTYDCYIGSVQGTDAAYLGSARGSSSYYTDIGFSTAGSAPMSVLENLINNTSNDTVYVSIWKSGSTGGNGYCQYGNLSVTYELAAPVVTEIIGDVTTSASATTFGSGMNYSVQVYNTLNVNVTSLKVEFFRGTNTAVADAYTMNNISIEPGAYMTVSSGVTFYAAPSGIGRSTPVTIKVTINGSSSQSKSFVTLLNKLYNPSIAMFALSRCSDVSGTMTKDDSGENVMSDIQIGLDSTTVRAFTLTVYYQQNGPASTATSTAINLRLTDENLAAFKNGYFDNTTMITRSGDFDNASFWGFRIVLTDGYETAIADYTLAKSFACMHLAGFTTGGAAFGMYSTAEEGSPKLESAYPIYAYGGINGCDYSTTETVTPFKWIDNKPIYRKVITYSTAISGGKKVSLTHGISGSTFGTLISIRGMGVQKDANNHFELKPLCGGLPGTMDASGLYVYADLNGTTLTINVETGSAYSTYNITSLFVIVEYTKK